MKNKEKQNLDYFKEELDYIEQTTLKDNYLSIYNNSRDLAYFLINEINDLPINEREEALDLCLESEIIKNLDEMLTTNKFYKDSYTIVGLLEKDVILNPTDEDVMQRIEFKEILDDLTKQIKEIYGNYELAVFKKDLAEFKKSMFKRKGEIMDSRGYKDE